MQDPLLCISQSGKAVNEFGPAEVMAALAMLALFWAATLSGTHCFLDSLATPQEAECT